MIDEAFFARCANAILEVLAAPFRPVELAVSGVSKVIEAAFQQVICGQVGNRAVVRLEPGKRGNQPGGADIHDRNTDLPQGLGNGDIFNTGDDTMALPVGEPARRFVSAVVFGQVKRPETMFANVGDNAPEQTSGIGVRCFNQQGDFDWRFQ